MFIHICKSLLNKIYSYLIQHVFLFSHLCLFIYLLNHKIRRYKNYAIFFSLMLIIASCGGNKKASPSFQETKSSTQEMQLDCAAEAYAAPMLQSTGGTRKEKTTEGEVGGERGNLDASIERLLIKNGYINFETTDIKASRLFINSLIKKHGAYIANEDENNSHTRIEINLTIKIPKNDFDAFLSELENAEKNVSSKNIEIEDVTEEFIDISARLAVKKEAEQTYLRLLSTAKTVRDVLDIQDQIQSIRSDIEGIEARLKYLEKSVAYSTLNIRMYQFIAKSEYLPQRLSFLRRAFASLQSGVKIFAEVVLAVLNAWLFILLFLAIGLFVRWKFFKKKK